MNLNKIKPKLLNLIAVLACAGVVVILSINTSLYKYSFLPILLLGILTIALILATCYLIYTKKQKVISYLSLLIFLLFLLVYISSTVSSYNSITSLWGGNNGSSSTLIYYVLLVVCSILLAYNVSYSLFNKLFNYLKIAHTILISIIFATYLLTATNTVINQIPLDYKMIVGLCLVFASHSVYGLLLKKQDLLLSFANLFLIAVFMFLAGQVWMLAICLIILCITLTFYKNLALKTGLILILILGGLLTFGTIFRNNLLPNQSYVSFSSLTNLVGFNNLKTAMNGYGIGLFNYRFEVAKPADFNSSILWNASPIKSPSGLVQNFIELGGLFTLLVIGSLLFLSYKKSQVTAFKQLDKSFFESPAFYLTIISVYLLSPQSTALLILIQFSIFKGLPSIKIPTETLSKLSMLKNYNYALLLTIIATPLILLGTIGYTYLDSPIRIVLANIQVITFDKDSYGVSVKSNYDKIANAVNIAPNVAEYRMLLAELSYSLASSLDENVTGVKSAVVDLYSQATKLSSEVTSYLAPETIEYWLRSAELYKGLVNKFANAELQVTNLYANASLLSPNNANLRYQMANFQFSYNNYTEAVNSATQAIQLKSDLAEAYLIRGRANVLLNNKQLAIQDFVDITKLSLESSPIYQQAAQELIKLQDKPE